MGLGCAIDIFGELSSEILYFICSRVCTVPIVVIILQNVYDIKFSTRTCTVVYSRGPEMIPSRRAVYVDNNKNKNDYCIFFFFFSYNIRADPWAFG